MADEVTDGTSAEKATDDPSVAVWIATFIGVIVGGFFGRLAAAQVGLVVGAVLGGLLAAALTALARALFLLVQTGARHLRSRSTRGPVQPGGRRRRRLP